MPPIAFRLAAGVVALTASLLGTPAHAQTASTGEQPVPPPPAETYTLHILAADAASIGVLAISGAIDASSSDDGFADGLAFVGIGGLALGGPIVHAAHGNWGRGALSLGLRVVLPLLGASIGASTADCQKDQFLCGLGEAAIGFMVGEATAIALDAGVLARWSAFQPAAGQAERGPEDPTETRPHARPPAVTFAPRIVATSERALLGVGGTFF